jgi:hypothetical protein
MWMDADAVVMNSSIPITDFLPDTEAELDESKQKHLIVDTSQNAGVWLVHNSPWANAFLDEWWNKKSFVKPKGISISGDNDALKALLKDRGQDALDHVLELPDCVFNASPLWMSPNEPPEAFYVNATCWANHTVQYFRKYHKGDFVAHARGIDNKAIAIQQLLEKAE